MSSMQNQSSRKLINDEFTIPDDLKKDVDKLISEGNTTIDGKLIAKLRSKYSDNNIVDAVIEHLSEQVSSIRNSANKFAKAIIKHSGQGTPLHTLLKRAAKYKEKLGLSDATFEFFKNIVYKNIQGKETSESAYSQGYPQANTNIARALGNLNVDSYDGMQIEQQDMPYLQEIIKQHAISKTTHASVVVQSLMYNEYAGEAMFGTYDSSKMNASCHVNPIVAAFFLPKIKLFEDTFLLANISYIVRSRYEKKQVLTSNDYILMYSMISDPTDVVCDIESPFKDLRNRALLQETLWQSVLALRNGRYYDCISTQFMSAVDNCKLNNDDGPDVIYLGDEVTILRRLLQAFSFKPILVTTMPLYGVVATNTLNFPVMKNRVTAIPMITVRLPLLTNIDQSNISLSDSLSAPQYFVENGTLVPKIQTIVYTRGVIIFHVTRRTQTPSFNAMISPHNWTNLMPTISGYEKVNTRHVTVDPFIDIGININNTTMPVQGGGRHFLKSIVAVNVNPFMPDLIIGTCTLLIKNDLSQLTGVTNYYCYNPQMAALKYISEDNPDQYETQNPIVKLDYENQNINRSFSELSSKYGTIYIYST